MTGILARTAAAELIKIRSLPAAMAAMLGTVIAGALLGAALAPDASDAARVVSGAVPLLQIGPILIGVLVVATEYAGRQITTTLAATPNRLLLLAGKTIAYLIAATATGIPAIAAAWFAFPAREVARVAAGAVAYLVLIGLLALALATLLRSLIPPLVGMLTLVLIVSPLLSGYTEHARWLPDQAGSRLYLPHADAETGAIVLLIWIAATASAAVVTFLFRDA